VSYYYQVASAGGFPYVATSSLAYTQPIRAPTARRHNAPGAAAALQLGCATRRGFAVVGDQQPRDHPRQVDLVALTLEYDLGFATMTSASSFAHHNNQTDDDLTALYTNFFFYQNFYGQNPRSFIQGKDQLDDKNWSQELRLTSKTGACSTGCGRVLQAPADLHSGA